MQAQNLSDFEEEFRSKLVCDESCLKDLRSRSIVKFFVDAEVFDTPSYINVPVEELVQKNSNYDPVRDLNSVRISARWAWFCRDFVRQNSDFLARFLDEAGKIQCNFELITLVMSIAWQFDEKVLKSYFKNPRTIASPKDCRNNVVVAAFFNAMNLNLADVFVSGVDGPEFLEYKSMTLSSSDIAGLFTFYILLHFYCILMHTPECRVLLNWNHMAGIAHRGIYLGMYASDKIGAISDKKIWNEPLPDEVHIVSLNPRADVHILSATARKFGCGGIWLRNLCLNAASEISEVDIKESENDLFKFCSDFLNYKNASRFSIEKFSGHHMTGDCCNADPRTTFMLPAPYEGAIACRIDPSILTDEVGNVTHLPGGMRTYEMGNTKPIICNESYFSHCWKENPQHGATLLDFVQCNLDKCFISREKVVFYEETREISRSYETTWKGWDDSLAYLRYVKEYQEKLAQEKWEADQKRSLFPLQLDVKTQRFVEVPVGSKVEQMDVEDEEEEESWIKVLIKESAEIVIDMGKEKFLRLFKPCCDGFTYFLSDPSQFAVLSGFLVEYDKKSIYGPNGVMAQFVKACARIVVSFMNFGGSTSRYVKLACDFLKIILGRVARNIPYFHRWDGMLGDFASFAEFLYDILNKGFLEQYSNKNQYLEPNRDDFAEGGRGDGPYKRALETYFQKCWKNLADFTATGLIMAEYGIQQLWAKARLKKMCNEITAHVRQWKAFDVFSEIGPRMAKPSGKIYSRGDRSKDIWSSAKKGHGAGKHTKHVMKGNKFHRIRIKRGGKVRTWRLLPQWEYDQLTSNEKMKLKEEFDHWRREYGEPGFVEADAVYGVGMSDDDRDLDEFWYRNYEGGDFDAELKAAEKDVEDYWDQKGYGDYAGSGFSERQAALGPKVEEINFNGDSIYRLQVCGCANGDAYLYECFWMGDSGLFKVGPVDPNKFAQKEDAILKLTSTPESILTHTLQKGKEITTVKNDVCFNELIESTKQMAKSPMCSQESVEIKERMSGLEQKLDKLAEMLTKPQETQLDLIHKIKCLEERLSNRELIHAPAARTIVLETNSARGVDAEKVLKANHDHHRDDLKGCSICGKLGHSEGNCIVALQRKLENMRKENKELSDRIIKQTPLPAPVSNMEKTERFALLQTLFNEQKDKAKVLGIPEMIEEQEERHAVLQQMAGGVGGVNLTTHALKPFVSNVQYQCPADPEGTVRTAIAIPHRISATNPDLNLRKGKDDLIGVLLTPLHTFDVAGTVHSKPCNVDPATIVLENIKFTGPGGQLFQCSPKFTQLCLVECHCQFCNNHKINEKGHATKSGRRMDCLAIIDVRVKQYFRTFKEGCFNPRPKFIYTINESTQPTRMMSNTDVFHIRDKECESLIMTQLNTPVNAGSSGSPIFRFPDNGETNPILIGLLCGVTESMGMRWSDGFILDHLNFRPLQVSTGLPVKSPGGVTNI